MTNLATTQLGIGSAWAVYAVGALFVVGGAFGVVLQRNPVHCALSLVVTIFGIALLFINQGANFLAAVQIIVYGGAIVILFLFVIMLLGVDRKEPRVQQKLRSLTPVAIVVSLVALVELLVLSRVHYWANGATSTTESLSGPGSDVQKLGQTIFTGYLLPFEMTSALLVIAVVAAVVLVRRSTQVQGTSPRKAAPAARPGPRLPEGTPGKPAGLEQAPQPQSTGAKAAEPAAESEQPTGAAR
ncbi:MAG TPA: NADH-quinone oxidoreductase subunit J [Acidimicrobiales bacterium]|nr:NADH-quinone oxidoreductase subunit J [Acidimicrobiales bacterium]